MRFDQVSGWELMGIQVLALIVVTPMLWLIGAGFRRTRLAQWLSLPAAAVAGAAIASGVVHADEAVVSSYLFAATLFLLGTVGMAVFLLAALPPTRPAAVGATLAGAVLVIAFILTYYVLLTFTPVKWLRSVRHVPIGESQVTNSIQAVIDVRTLYRAGAPRPVLCPLRVLANRLDLD
jgi:hypothetical protein